MPWQAQSNADTGVKKVHSAQLQTISTYPENFIFISLIVSELIFAQNGRLKNSVKISKAYKIKTSLIICGKNWLKSVE